MSKVDSTINGLFLIALIMGCAVCLYPAQTPTIVFPYTHKFPKKTQFYFLVKHDGGVGVCLVNGALYMANNGELGANPTNGPAIPLAMVLRIRNYTKA